MIKSLKYKKAEFVILYGLLNVYFFYGINKALNTFSDLYSRDIYVDGSNFRPLNIILGLPFLLFAIAFLIAEEIVFTLIFRLVYFRSVVTPADMPKLTAFITWTIWLFIPVNLVGAILFRNAIRFVLFIMSYMFLPLFAFLLIYLKCKKMQRNASHPPCFPK